MCQARPDAEGADHLVRSLILTFHVTNCIEGRQRHPEESSAQTMEGKAESRVMGGYKATLKSKR
jgi:hypothetical protein